MYGAGFMNRGCLEALRLVGWRTLGHTVRALHEMHMLWVPVAGHGGYQRPTHEPSGALGWRAGICKVGEARPCARP
ncbi:hypothetical protein A0H81_13673 [Grifola frondosa]|uniref:Uncharacterized protein n=1 Tax=Grifola frondosa TaxID=5627 RepID=A0A1C7LQR3_GRIFR|nr:hypothetical protein A0H81_13673 [Grifola frondosa]